MDKLSFNDTINFIKVKIEDYGVSHIGAEVFIGQKSKCVSQWLSIAGNDFVLKPVLGACSKKLDKIVGAALKKVVPTFVVGRVSVPIFRVPAERISTKDLRIIQGRTNGPGYDMKEILEFLEW